MLLHSSVAMETCFGHLGLYLENFNSFTSQFDAKNFMIKTLRSALKRPENHQICHKYNLLRNRTVTNLNFNNAGLAPPVRPLLDKFNTITM